MIRLQFEESSFSDAEPGKNRAQNFFGVDTPCYFAHSLQSVTQFEGDDFRSSVMLERLSCIFHGFRSALEVTLMPGIDGDKMGIA